MEANVIDMAILSDRGSLIYSMDMIHCRFSTSVTASEEEQHSRLAVGAIRLTADDSWFEKDLDLHEELVPTMEQSARSRLLTEQKNTAKGKSLRELLYGLEGLRKRGGEDGVRL